MSAHKHTPGTPGKWFVGQKVRDGSICVVGDIDSVVCEFGERLGGVEADARLIAAAPELLLELRQAVVQMEMAAQSIQNKRYDEALLHVTSLMRSKRAAIAKATGEPA